LGAITPDTTLPQLAALVSQALEQAGISATLSGGGAVSLYTDNEYQSYDLDFVSSERLKLIREAIAPLGFCQVHGRQFEHPDSRWYLEFPSGPLAFGETSFSDDDACVVDTGHGPLRIVTPTQIVMDRVAAYVHWRDHQSLDQAVMVARHQTIEWPALYDWAEQDGIEKAVIDELKQRVDR
jgi:hypothetical protein